MFAFSQVWTKFRIAWLARMNPFRFQVKPNAAGGVIVLNFKICRLGLMGNLFQVQRPRRALGAVHLLRSWCSGDQLKVGLEWVDARAGKPCPDCFTVRGGVGI